MAMAKEMMGGGLSAGQALAIGGGYSALAALGSSQATAAPITASMTIVSGADGTKGVILPAGQVGDVVWVFNNSGSTCPVYPDAGAAIAVAGTGLGTANAAFSQLTYKTTIYINVSSAQWLANTSA